MILRAFKIVMVTILSGSGYFSAFRDTAIEEELIFFYRQD